MKVRVVAVLAAVCALAAAEVTVRGVLNNDPGGTPHRCVTESTLLVVEGVQTWYVTSGWVAGPNEMDTFVFPPVAVYPESAAVTATFDSTTFVVLEIPHPSPVIAYQFPQPYRRITVRLEIVDGLEGGNAAAPAAGFSITPSVVREAALIRAARPGRLDVLDAAGTVVRSFATPLERTWSRDDAAGRRLGAGVYFMRLTSGSGTAVRKVVLDY